MEGSYISFHQPQATKDYVLATACPLPNHDTIPFFRCLLGTEPSLSIIVESNMVVLAISSNPLFLRNLAHVVRHLHTLNCI